MPAPAASCSHSCDKGEVVVSALCVGGAGAAQFKLDGGDTWSRPAAAPRAVTMQLYCMKP